MNDFPNLAILLLSYMRTVQAIRTINGIVDNLIYKGGIAWYVADDGSEEKEFNKIIEVLNEKRQTIIGSHNHRYSPYTGVGWNKGLGLCYQYSDYVLILEDDWELTGNFDMHPENHPGEFNINPYLNSGKLDLCPYVEMLSQREDVGIIRLGGLAVGNTVEIVGHNGHHYLKYLRQQPYAYSGNPHIRHARFIQTYGWYFEGQATPGELEVELDWRFRTNIGPDIWRPSDIPGWGIFHHIGEKVYR